MRGADESPAVAIVAGPGGDAPPARHVYTVTELVTQIRGALEEGFPEVWVEGEITNLTAASSGHIYFALKDEQSQLKAAFFHRWNRHLAFRLEPGLKVRCLGRISAYAPRSEYQVIVEEVEPSGVGALQLAFEQLKARLLAEGLCDPARKRPLPFFPARVGIVTSLTGRALRDILTVFDQRCPRVHVVIRPALVQGPRAAEEVAAAIRDLNEARAADVLLVGRGGGSLEDLWAFNEEVVARAIAASAIPVVSCVGHELDVTIADFVADWRAGTPSIAAEQVLPRWVEVVERVETATWSATRALQRSLEQARGRLTACRDRYFFRQPERLWQDVAQRRDRVLLELRATLDRAVAARRARWVERVATLRLLAPQVQLAQWRGRRAHAARRLRRWAVTGVAGWAERVGALARQVSTLGPRQVLARGYSVTRTREGRVLRRASTVRAGELIETWLADGALWSQVEQIKRGQGRTTGGAGGC